MGFVMGGCCLSHSPLNHAHVFSSSSSSSSSQSAFMKRSRAPMATLRQEDSDDTVLLKRRPVLFVGISVLPLLQMRAVALEENGELLTKKEKQSEELPRKGDSRNPFLSLLGGLGIFSTGSLGALYALARKEMKATDDIVESMKIKLKEEESAFVSMENNFNSRLLNEQEERTKQLKKAKEEHLSLMNQLSSANTTITGLEQELRNEKRACEEVKLQLESLQSLLLKAGEDKKVLEETLKEKLDTMEVLQDRINLLSLELKEKEDNIQNLSSSLTKKELELKNLTSGYNQARDELEKAKSELVEVKNENLKTQNELESKNSVVGELNASLASIDIEIDDYKRRLDDTLKDYNKLKLSSEKQATLNANLLEERDCEICQLKVKVNHVAKELGEGETKIADLTQERKELKRMLQKELTNVKNLNQELKITQETLEKSRNEASDLAKQLNQSRNLCAELEFQVSKVQSESIEAREQLQRSLDEVKRSSDMLASELTAANELLKKTKDELQVATCELAVAKENHSSLEKELMDAHKKAETTANNLKEERKVVSALSKELQALEKQILKNKEARKSLETDLEEATKSLDEMNRNALTLSRELEKATSHISRLEDEKELLYKSLREQKGVSKEAEENMEDAHKLVMRLGKERESFEKRAMKLEEELGSAKGEILRLRSQVNLSSKVNVNDQETLRVEAKGRQTIAAKKSGRRRKAS